MNPPFKSLLKRMNYQNCYWIKEISSNYSENVGWNLLLKWADFTDFGLSCTLFMNHYTCYTVLLLLLLFKIIIKLPLIKAWNKISAISNINR